MPWWTMKCDKICVLFDKELDRLTVSSHVYASQQVYVKIFRAIYRRHIHRGKPSSWRTLCYTQSDGDLLSVLKNTSGKSSRINLPLPPGKKTMLYPPIIPWLRLSLNGTESKKKSECDLLSKSPLSILQGTVLGF